MRRANSSELPDAAVLAKQGVGNSPRSSSSAYVPFSAMNAVEVCPEVHPTPPSSWVFLCLAGFNSFVLEADIEGNAAARAGKTEGHVWCVGSTAYGERQE